MSPKLLIVLGTSNRKKGCELAKVLAPLDVEFRVLADFPNAIEVVEDGETFAANAASALASRCGNTFFSSCA